MFSGQSPAGFGRLACFTKSRCRARPKGTGPKRKLQVGTAPCGILYIIYNIYTAVQLRYAARKRGQKTAKAARASLPAPTARNNHKNSRFVTDPAQSGLLIFGYFTQLFRAFCENTPLLNIFYHIFATFKV